MRTSGSRGGTGISGRGFWDSQTWEPPPVRGASKPWDKVRRPGGSTTSTGRVGVGGVGGADTPGKSPEIARNPKVCDRVWASSGNT